MSARKFNLTPVQAVDKLADICNQDDPREISHFVVWYVEDLISAGALDEIDNFLLLVSPEVPLWASVAILRSSYRVSDKLDNWVTYRDAVRKAHANEPRLNRLLMGLDQVWRSNHYD